MGDDQVTIDPRFHPPPDRGGRAVWVAIAAAAVVAVAFGTLLSSATSVESDESHAASSTQTFPAATTSPAASSVSSARPNAPLAALEMPLSDAVPGFTDAIALLTTPPDGFNVMRWSPDEYRTRVVLSLERDDAPSSGSWPVGLDASGQWFAQGLSDGILTVHPVADAGDRLVQPEAIGLHVQSVAWHDTEPGLLAWVECPRSSSGSADLYTLDVADDTADRVLVRSFEGACREGAWGDESTVWVERSTSGGGFLIRADEEDTPKWILVGTDGTGTSIDSDSTVPVEAPEGEPVNPGPSLAEDESLWETTFSPDWRLAALIVGSDRDEPGSKLRIVQAATGDAIAEFAEPGSELITMAWSTNGRFLVYESWNFDSGPGALVFYDTATNTTTTVPLSEIVDEIRTDIGLPPVWAMDGSKVNRADVDAATISPSSNPTLVPSAEGDASLDTSMLRLTVGVRTTAPDNPRLDFLNTICDESCYRDAVVVAPEGGRRGTWLADTPFHVRHGFVNEGEEPLGPSFEVVLFVTRRNGVTLAGDGYTLNHMYRFSSDYVLHGVTNQCGPGYWDQTQAETCEWFVHDFPAGLPEGRYDIWAEWIAPCSAWLDLELIETCLDPTLPMTRFASSVNMPFSASDSED